MDNAQEKIETWRHDYNNYWPHISLNGMKQVEYTVIYQITSRITLVVVCEI
jgi:hypothetical protein